MALFPIAPHKSTLLPRLVCDVVFCAFSFLYLYAYQADVLAVAQHVLSAGKTAYGRTMGAVLITLAVYLMHLGVCALRRQRAVRCYALTFAPSLLVLAIITGLANDIGQRHSTAAWWIVTPLLGLLVGGIMWVVWHRHPQLSKPFGLLSQAMWLNLLVLSVMFLLVCLLGGHSEIFHYRAKMEQALLEKDYGKALAVGRDAQVTDSSMVMLRAYALSRTHAMGERLFEYPLVGGSGSLLPNGSSVRLLMLPPGEIYRHIGAGNLSPTRPLVHLASMARRGKATRPAGDYMLCGYLLDKKLDAFVSHLPQYYRANSLLPKHYREALLLYNRLRSNPAIVYHDDVLEADYKDYLELEKKYPGQSARQTRLRDIYGKTYWYYYQYQP